MTHDKVRSVCDVAIIGSGMTGTILAMILARNGASVVVTDKGRHPRFSLGESTVRDTAKFMHILADRFGVPEIDHTANYVGVKENISHKCGLKRHVGFAFHREGERQRPGETYQAVLPDAFEGPEVHYFREDIDMYLVDCATRYGAEVRQGVDISSIHFGEDDVTLATSAGDTIRARFVVDASGHGSVLAKELSLRERPCRLRTCSRSIFTHMRGVKPYEACSVPGVHEVVPRRWSEGTLHHCFDGGWIWVIPFNNVGDSTNPLVSVGLQLDGRNGAQSGIDVPAREFASMLSRFPSIAEQFADAEAVIPWMTTGTRMQYSSVRTVGHRWAMTANTMGFVDALYSRGIPMSMAALLPLADSLLSALADDNFSLERFELVEQFQQRTLDRVDELIDCSYSSFRNYELFNAWVRVWYAAINTNALYLAAVHSKYAMTRAPVDLLRAFLPEVGEWCAGLGRFKTFFAACVCAVHAADSGDTTPEQAADKIFALLANADFLAPSFKLHDRTTKHGGGYGLEQWLEVAVWGNYHAPPDVQTLFFPGDPEKNVDLVRARWNAYVTDPRYRDLQKYLDDTSVMK